MKEMGFSCIHFRLIENYSPLRPPLQTVNGFLIVRISMFYLFFRIGAPCDQVDRDCMINLEESPGQTQWQHRCDIRNPTPLETVYDQTKPQLRPSARDSAAWAPSASAVMKSTSDKTNTSLPSKSTSNQDNRKEGSTDKPHISSSSTSDILLMSLNVNGLRQRRKVTALGKCIPTLCPQPDICILVETHLTEEETDKFKLSTYRKARSHCRTLEEGQIKGGVLIMVKNRVSFSKADDLPGVELPLNSCSIWLYLGLSEMPVVRLTGVYFTPAAKTKMSQVEMLTGARSHTQ